MEGKKWIDKHVLIQEAVSVYHNPNEKLVRKGKGIYPAFLKQPWQELAVIIQNYITCDGHLDVVKSRQIQFLFVLKQKNLVNLPFFHELYIT